MKDPIADMIIQIKNAGSVKKESTTLVYSKLKMAILECLLKAGFIKSFTKKGKKIIKYIEVFINYNEDGRPKIEKTQRISKTSKRVYIKAKEIHPVRSGFGLMILSTPKGIFSGAEAKKAQLGGEVLFKVW